MGLVHSNQPIFTSPAQLLRQALDAVRQRFKRTEESSPAPVSERPYDPVIDWEQNLEPQRGIVSPAAQWFLLGSLWIVATAMVAVSWRLA